MNLKTRLFLIFGLMTPMMALGVVPDHYMTTVIGEKIQADLLAVSDPVFEYSQSTKSVRFPLTNSTTEWYLGVGEPAISRIDDFLKHEFPRFSGCGNESFAHNYDYVRYLYRLLSISYLYQTLLDTNIERYRFGYNHEVKECQIDFENVFSKCQANSTEMKLFITRLPNLIPVLLDKKKYIRAKKKDMDVWLEKFNQHEKIPGVFPELIRAQNSTTKISLAQIDSLSRAGCQTIKNEIQKICSEKDFYYGISRAPFFSYVLSRSNVFSFINTDDKGQVCLDRFVNEHGVKEEDIQPIAQIFNSLNHWYKTNRELRPEGPLFIAGALKEFELHGIDQLILRPKAEVPVQKVVEVIAPVIERPVIIAETNKIETAPIKIEASQPVKVEEVVVQKSYFQTEVDRLISQSISKIALEMAKFEKDFVFKPEHFQKLDGPLQRFQQRKALKEMKTIDKLGSFDQPMNLIFLKYLIDKNSHQGLFNIISVLGERFYVENSIDNIKSPVLISLKNDVSTGLKWQITILAD